MESANSVISFAINLIIFILTLILTIGFFREDGKWNIAKGKRAFRYFTVLSNELCAISALLMCCFPDAGWTFYLKYVGTVAVTLTMMTVLLFLGPTRGYGAVLKGYDLYMHLVTPLLALISLCVFERREISLAASFLGLIPGVLYGLLYMYKVLYAPIEERWEDFYGFNRNGRWQISSVLMFAGTALICIVFYFILKI